MAWNLACPDWADRIAHGRSLIPKLPLIQAEADRAVAIFNQLRLPDVAGRPALATAAGTWQRDIVGALFGSWDGHERHIREIFALVPKKNAKTTTGAALMLTAVLMNKRPRAEFLIVAPTQEVSDLAFRQAVGMIEGDVVLAAKFHIQEHLKRITYRPTGAFLKVKSFDPKIVTGTKPSGVLLDELHVIAEAPDADRVIGQLRGGLISQPEGFLVVITTQGERAPAGVFRAELMKARKVRDGTLVAPILPVLYEFPDGVDWREPANWHMVTPNAGRSITVERLVPDYHAAVEAGEGELRRWASQHLNVEIGLSLRSNSWVGADYWQQQAEPALTLDAVLARSEVCTIGIDGGGLDDLLGLAVLGRCKATRRWLHWGRAWAHPVALQRRKSEAARLGDFAEQGDLVLVERLGDDIAEVADIARRLNEAHLLPDKEAVGLDPAGIGAIIDALSTAGLTGDQVVGVTQGWRLGGAIKTAERKLAEGTLMHGGRPLMTWCVGNAKVEQRANSILITKQASGTAKIDPLMALFNAVDLLGRNPVAVPAFNARAMIG
jgi:phage terminase large subunit-like protein